MSARRPLTAKSRRTSLPQILQDIGLSATILQLWGQKLALWRQFLAHELLGGAHHMLGGGVRPPQRLHHMLGGGSRPPQRLHHMLGGGWGVSRSAPPSLEAMCACSNRSSHVVRQVIGKELRGYMTAMERATPLPRGGGGTWTPPCSHAATVNRSATVNRWASAPRTPEALPAGLAGARGGGAGGCPVRAARRVAGRVYRSRERGAARGRGGWGRGRRPPPLAPPPPSRFLISAGSSETGGAETDDQREYTGVYDIAVRMVYSR